MNEAANQVIKNNQNPADQEKFAEALREVLKFKIPPHLQGLWNKAPSGGTGGGPIPAPGPTPPTGPGGTQVIPPTGPGGTQIIPPTGPGGTQILPPRASPTAPTEPNLCAGLGCPASPYEKTQTGLGALLNTLGKKGGG